MVANHASTTDMQVTSIRLESELKEKLKEIAGSKGYQSLIRHVLWEYVSSAGLPGCFVDPVQIVSVVKAISLQEQSCAVTGKTIYANEEMYLGLCLKGSLLPLSLGWSLRKEV